MSLLVLIYVSAVFPPRPAWHYDIHKSLENLPAEKPKPSVVLRAEDVMTSRKFYIRRETWFKRGSNVVHRIDILYQ